MLNIGDAIPLPSDPKQLTRELALKCCTHPEVIVQEFARLTTSAPGVYEIHNSPHSAPKTDARRARRADGA